MRTGILKRVRFERYLIAVFMAAAMVGTAELSGETEIIFPEICALTIGAWISEQQPWECNKRKMFFLTSITALFGIIVTRYLPVPLIFQVFACFAFTGVVITITKTTFIPIISAGILPVYLGTKSWIYPVSVTLMSLIIITVQWLMEKRGLRPKNKYTPCDYNYKFEALKWLKMLIVFGLAALIPFSAHQIYFLAPPLIVTFAEFSNPESPLINKPFKIIFLMTASSATGCLLKFLLNIHLNLPLSVCTFAACIVLFIVFHKIRIKFPPAGAILLIPMVLPQEKLLYLPFEVMVGAFVLIFCAKYMFGKQNIKTV